MTDLRHPSSRRRFLVGSAALVGTTFLAGCDKVGANSWARRLLDKDEDANFFVQRLLQSDQKLAPEYTEAEISPKFKPNGTEDPSDKAYKALAKTEFRDFSLAVDGLVYRPDTFTLKALRAMSSRTQITRHDCVEGWSCIGKWTGVPLSALLQKVGLKPEARFVVFHCFDAMDEGGGSDQDGGGLEALGGPDDAPDGKSAGGDAKATMTPDDAASPEPAKPPGSKKADSKKAADQETDVGSRYYESIDLTDAFHPQTILAYAMNDKSLPIAHGAPLRLRLERQLGYKMAKYVRRITVVDTLAGIGKGGGGYWEDNGYEWYAGI